jgi:hypothetical protein
MKEPFIIDAIRGSIRDIINSTGLLRIIEIKSNTLGYTLKQRIDITVQVENQNQQRFYLLFEIKSVGQPRFVRMAVSFLKEMISNDSNCYGIVVSTFISEESRQICKQNDIGYLDLAGNCYLKFDGIYIHTDGKKDLYPESRSLKSVFSTKASRVLRILLCNPGKAWYVRDLADESKISLGLCSNIKKQLLNYEYISEFKIGTRTKFKLTNPEELINQWSENYTYKINILAEYYSMDDVNTIEKKMIDYFNSNQIKYALSLTSGASLTTPFLRYKRVFSYLCSNFDKVAQDLDYKMVNSGGNIVLMRPYDEGVYYGLQKVRGACIVSDVQLYLDLKHFGERGIEASEFIMENRLRKKW